MASENIVTVSLATNVMVLCQKTITFLKRPFSQLSWANRPFSQRMPFLQHFFGDMKSCEKGRWTVIQTFSERLFFGRCLLFWRESILMNKNESHFCEIKKYFVSNTRIQENFLSVSKMQSKTVFKSDFLLPPKMHEKRRIASPPNCRRF